MKVLVTGATGQLGGHVVDALLNTIPASDIAVSVRDAKKATHFADKGIDVREASFDDVAAVEKAVEGIDRVLVISTLEPDHTKRIAQHANVFEAAKKAGVEHVLYTSGTKADISPIDLNVAHKGTEEALKNTGVNYTILRNNLYLELEIPTIQAAVKGAPLMTNAADGRISYALRQELGQAAAAVLIGEGHENKTYELSGKPLSYDDLAKAITNVTGKDVAVQHVDDATYSAMLEKMGVPSPLAQGLAQTRAAVRDGYLDVADDTLEILLGRPQTSIEEVIKQIVAK